MRQNLNKKEIVNSIYMQLGYPKNLIENILEDIFDIILQVTQKQWQSKNIKFWNLLYLDIKNQRVGRNPKTKKDAVISERNVVLFKPSKYLKNKINNV